MGWHEDFGDSPSIEERNPEGYDEFHRILNELADEETRNDNIKYEIIASKDGQIKTLARAIGDQEADYLISQYMITSKGWQISKRESK